MNLFALPVMADNYVWILHHDAQAVVVDPGVAEPVASALQARGLALAGILLTHHHADHIGGVDALYRHCAAAGTPVYLPAADGIADNAFASVPVAALRRCAGGTTVQLLGHSATVLDTPGHTAGHIGYFFEQQAGLDAPVLLCGDTLFSAGCGRVFDGTVEQLHASLQALSALPAATRICCAHEYTLANLRFVRAVEPHNAALDDYTVRCQALREQGLPTLPSTLAQELAINPFLRLDQPTVQAAARQYQPTATTAVQVFAALRAWKNQF